MHVYKNTKSIRQARALFMGTELGALIGQCINELSEYEQADLSELVKIIVLDPNDAMADIDAELGFSLLNRNCDLAVMHQDWFELTLVLSDDGFGAVIYVPRHVDTCAQLLAYCAGQSEQLRA